MKILLMMMLFISFISLNHWPYLKFLILFEYLTIFILFSTIFSLKSNFFFIFMFVAVCEAILSLCFLVSSSLDYLLV